MKATIFNNGQEVELEYEILAPGIYVYKNAIPKEWNCIERIENALAIPGTRFKWKQAGLGYGNTDLDHRRCKDFKIKENILEPRDDYSSDMLDMHKQVMDSLKSCMSHYTNKNY
jgi:hypothetical protein